ncbi:MAG TPA: hypothetical protein VMB81_10265 [Candidatus Sulfotelmatobacter sp.]|nr:hypothetical protein [Candidatus Sulfotelmatobacter sp.]
MSRWEWLVVAAMLVIALAVASSHLGGSWLGAWLAGEQLPELARDADNRVFYAIPLLALLIWWASRLFPNAREFLTTGAFVLIGIGILYALYLLVS